MKPASLFPGPRKPRDRDDGSPLILHWLVGAVIWGFVSLTIITQYLKTGGSEELLNLWYLCSILWAEFGVGALFVCLMRNQGRHLTSRLLILLLPPVLLYMLIDSLAWIQQGSRLGR